MYNNTQGLMWLIGVKCISEGFKMLDGETPRQ